MVWKIYDIDTGKLLKAGFEDEDDAKDWLLDHFTYAREEYQIEEMDSDEEQEWLESRGENDEDEDDTEDDSDPTNDDFSDDFYEDEEDRERDREEFDDEEDE